MPRTPAPDREAFWRKLIGQQSSSQLQFDHLWAEQISRHVDKMSEREMEADEVNDREAGDRRGMGPW